ncbi:GumC family protein [Lunatibacter salilacus]|uniref:GumC family protein n=1 Tax=Lunatibacter salilacus TaxID=2483804 RepID=UPI00131C3F4D|nr:polysaccharide biosynthesis tyrosine autokinase [Lunatibacter salilacus]
MEESEEEIDLKEILFKYLRYWPLLFICAASGLTFAFIFNKIAIPLYQIESSVLIKEEAGMTLGADIFEGTGLSKPNNNLQNEIGILKSRSLAAETLNMLNYNVTYYQEGFFNELEMFGNIPFLVEVDWKHPQLTNGKLSIIKKDSNTYRLTIEDDAFSLFSPSDPNYKTGVEYLELQEDDYTFGEWLEGINYRFRVMDINGEVNNPVLFEINDTPSLANQYIAALTITPLSKDGSILILGLEHNNRKKGEVYLNKLVDVYLERELQEKNLTAANTVKFIDEQLSGISDSLSFIEDRLETYRTENQVFNLSQEGSLIFERLNELEREKSTIELSLTYYRTVMTYLNEDQLEDLAAPSFIGIQDPLLNALVLSLGELQSERVELSATFSAEAPAVREVISKIRNTKSTLMENIRSAIANAEVSLSEINQRLSTTSREINKLPATERNLMGIQRQFAINENIYIYLLEKRAEAEITRASNSPTNVLLDSAKSGSQPIAPKKTVNYLIGIILGLIVPLSFITVRDFFNVKIGNPQEVEKKLRIPLIGLVNLSTYKNNLVIFDKPKSMITESFRNLRANMGYLAPNQSKLVFALTSTISGEGKTFCSINLASIYAISDKKVILVGLDLRKPRIADDFGLVNDMGVSTYLSSDKDWRRMVKKTKENNLDILLSGPVPPNPAELLLQDNFQKLIQELKETYDVVILDCPPVGLVSETYEIFKFSDLNLMIVRQDYSDKQSLEFINSLAEKKSVKKLYAILNGVQKSKNSYGSYGGYGNYGYGYGSSGYYDDELPRKRDWWKNLIKRTKKNWTNN